jgi:3D (Asp-Asp-Asp) domain-containing protein
MTCQTRNHPARKTSRFLRALFAGATLFAVACGGSPDADADANPEDVGGTQDALGAKSSFVSRATGYYPSSSQLEGGFTDRVGHPLHTLQQFLAGSAPYVAVAMDSSAFPYGARLRIHEIDAKYGQSVVFRVVDTGGAFRGRGRARIDVCVANRSASLDATINGTVHIDVVDER